MAIKGDTRSLDYSSNDSGRRSKRVNSPES